MAKKLSTDLSLVAITVALLGLGLVMVWSASYALAQERQGNAYHFLIKQALWTSLGLTAMVATLRMDYRKLRRPAVVYGVAGVSTLLLIVVLFLKPVNDVHRWIRLGGLSFQPAELAKLAVILFLAYHLERRGDRVNEFLPSLFPALLLLGWFAFLVFIQPDLGSAATLTLTGLRDAVPGGHAPALLRHPRASGASRPLPGDHGRGLQARPHRGLLEPVVRCPRHRLPDHPEPDRRGHGGRHRPRPHGRPPEALLPALSLQRLHLCGDRRGARPARRGRRGPAFVFFLWRGLRAAWKAPDDFGLYLAAGLTLAVVLQGFINMSVVLGLVPTKGIPLPFISAGGSSLVFTLAGVGLILNVSQHAD